MSGLGLSATGDNTWKRAIERRLRDIAPEALKAVQEENTCAARLEGYLASQLWPGASHSSGEIRQNLERYFRVLHGLRRADFRALAWQERADQLLADFWRAAHTRRGRPRDTDPAADSRLSDEFKRSRSTYAQFAATKGIAERDARAAVDRDRKRKTSK